MERPGRRAKAGSLSGLSGGLPSGVPNASGVRRQRSLEWGGDRYSSSDDDRPPKPPPLADRVFASLLAQATQQFDNEQRRMYGSEGGDEPPLRYAISPQRQASPFPLESTNRRYYRRNRNSKGEEVFSNDTGGTMSRRRRGDDFVHENNVRNARHCHNSNGTSGSVGQASERECESPPEPAPPEVPPRGPSLHVTLRHRPCEQPAEPDRLYISEEFVLSEGGGAGTYPARSPLSSSTTGHSSSSHHRFYEKFKIPAVTGCIDGTHVAIVRPSQNEERFYNRKGYHSRNVLIICDADLNILSVDSSFGGATHDTFVWNQHPVKTHLSTLINAGERVYLLGDSGYPQREYMMTPIVDAPPGSPEENYTKLHCVARNTVERTIGVLKNRWRCLLAHRVLHYHPDTAAKIINACCVLHNICNRARLGLDDIEDATQYGRNATGPGCVRGGWRFCPR